MRLFKPRPKLQVGYWDVPERDNCKFNIVGESFHEDQIRALLSGGKELVKSSGDLQRLGVQFWLVRDLHNRHDKNAIAVCASLAERYDHATAIQVGHLDRATAAMYASDVDKPVPVKGMIVGRVGGRFGVKLNKADMAVGGLSSEELKVDIHESVVQSLVRRGREREDEWEVTKNFAASLKHSPDVTGDPNTIEVVITKGKTVAGIVSPTARLWGPHVDGLKATLRLHRMCYERFGDEYDEEDEFWGEVTVRLPRNAHEATNWECGPYCAQVNKTWDGQFQAVGRLLHTRFKIPTCDASKEAFREAKRLNSSLK